MPIFDDVDITATETGDNLNQGAVNFEEVKKRLFGGKRKVSGKKSSESSAEKLPSEKELDEIFAGENWEEIAGLYFNARFAITGFDGFLLTPAQKKTLGLSLSTTMKMLLKIDPGYIALVVFTINFGGLIAQKEMTYKTLKGKEHARKTA